MTTPFRMVTTTRCPRVAWTVRKRSTRLVRGRWRSERDKAVDSRVRAIAKFRDALLRENARNVIYSPSPNMSRVVQYVYASPEVPGERLRNLSLLHPHKPKKDLATIKRR